MNRIEGKMDDLGEKVVGGFQVRVASGRFHGMTANFVFVQLPGSECMRNLILEVITSL